MRHPNILMLSLAVCMLLLTPGCSDDPAGDSNGGALSSLGLSLEQAGSDFIVLVADPAEVVIDTTDPNTPTNMGGLFIGTTVITATVVDIDGNPEVGAEIVFSSTAGSLASGGAPVLTDDMGMASDTLEVTQDDGGTVTVQVDFGAEHQTTDVLVTVILPNQPPVADAGTDQTVECTSPDGAGVNLDGSASSDPDSTSGTNDDIVLFEWLVDGEVIATGAMAGVTLPVGTTTVTLRVTDNAGATAEDEVVIMVADNTPPQLGVSVNPDEMWPPNHKMRDVRVRFRVVEVCSPPDEVSIILRDVSSNEPENGLGDGDTEPDIMGADIGEPDDHLQLRAERSGRGNSRIYTLVYTAEDAAGNSVRARATVTVPHDKGDETHPGF